MPRFGVSTLIDAPIGRVWAILADWEGSSSWMVDATKVEVIGDRRDGAGTKVRSVTKVAGVPLIDEMTVTQWDPPHLMVVRHHHWPIRGIAWFALAEDGTRVRFDWVEELDPPLGPLGELGGVALRRPIERLLEKSARKLKAVAESTDATTAGAAAR
ncbi:MAG: SRPBCC family protein [Actinomycetota bacterium]|nr:SRPBCC family protein [Actinomycetota bacterium]